MVARMEGGALAVGQWVAVDEEAAAEGVATGASWDQRGEVAELG